MCIRYDALSFGGIREKRERERATKKTTVVVPKEKNPKNECDLKNRVYEKSGIFRGFDFDPTSIDEIDERQRERDREREIRN